MSDKITEEFSKLPDPDYEAYRARLDEENIEDGSELENEDHEDHVDGIFKSLFKKKKPDKPTVPVSKKSDFGRPRYRMDRKKMGSFLIFTAERFKTAHKYFGKPLPPLGAKVSAKKLENSIERLGFDVYRYDDVTTDEVLNTLERYASAEANKDSNAFGCVFFSYGEENGEMATFDGFLNVKKLIEKTHHEYLAGRPRLFFFQACRPGNLDRPKFKSVALDHHQTLTWPMEADILCHFATSEYCFGAPKSNWFVENLTNVLDNYALEIEFHHVLLLVNRGIALMQSKGTCSLIFMNLDTRFRSTTVA